MKYAIVLASGMADEPLDKLSGRTPTEAAHSPALDALAGDGKTGGVKTLPDDLPASEGVALLSALGYDPHRYFTGEAALAAAGLGLDLGSDHLALVHSLATEANGTMADHAAGQVSPREADALLRSLSGALARSDVKFHTGRGFYGVTTLPSLKGPCPTCMPPEEVMGASIEACLPSGEGAELLRRLISLSRELFREHDVNRVRADLGENPANIFWPWSAGRSPELPAFESLHKLRAAMVAGHEAARGLGCLSGMHVPDVVGATGSYRTDYAAKAQRALELLEEFDLVVIHVASPADASLEGNIQRKIGIIEDIDAMITAPLLKHAREGDNTRILFIATHVASVLKRTRTHAEVPLAMYGPGLDAVRHGSYSEAVTGHGEISVAQGHELLQYFLRC